MILGVSRQVTFTRSQQEPLPGCRIDPHFGSDRGLGAHAKKVRRVERAFALTSWIRSACRGTVALRPGGSFSVPGIFVLQFQEQVPTTVFPFMHLSQQDTSDLLTETEAGGWLKVSPATLRAWRCRGIGPAYIKMGRGIKAPVRYTVQDIQQFIAEFRHVPLLRAAYEG